MPAQAVTGVYNGSMVSRRLVPGDSDCQAGVSGAVLGLERVSDRLVGVVRDST